MSWKDGQSRSVVAGSKRISAALVTEMWVRLGGIYEAVRGAASADAEARDLWETALL